MHPNKKQADAVPEYTPGPWKINHINDQIIIGGRAFGIENVLSIAEVTKLKHHSQENAWLIAAAPDLLEVLEKALEAIEYFNDHEGCPALLGAAKAAIAKAKGT
jgi:hypothetical protein